MQVFTGIDMLAASAEAYHDKIAVKDKTQALTYRELRERAQALGRYLADRGIGKGDVVGIFQGLSVDSVIAIFGVWHSGAAFVAVNPALKALQVSQIAEDTGMRLMITDRPDFFAEVTVELTLTDVPAAISAEVTGPSPRVIDRDLANLIFTSGSTGRPKGVMFTHGDIVMLARVMAELFDNRPDDNILCVLPFSADYGLTLLYTTMLVGGRLTLLESFFPNDIVKAITEEQITSFGAVREMWPLLFGPRSLFPTTEMPSLRYISCGGGVPPQGVIHQMIEKFDGLADIYLLYGLTEASWSTYLPPQRIKDKLGSIGVPVPNVELFVVDEEGNPVAPGEEGELVHRGGVVAKGYWNEAERTRRVFGQSPIVSEYLRDAEKVCHSGDIVTVDEEGFFYYKGRKDGQIKVRGYRIATQDVVDAMYATGLVADCCIFGVPDDQTGERIIACVVPKQNDPEVTGRLGAALKEVLPRFSVPAEYFTLRDLPLTHSVKYDTTRLTGLYNDKALEDGMSFVAGS